MEDIIMTHEQFTEELYKQYRSPEEAAIALTASLKHYEFQKEKLDQTLVDAIITGGEKRKEWERQNERYTTLIEETDRKLEELKAYIAVGYPQCMHTNASSVLDVYKEKIMEYKIKNGLTNAEERRNLDFDWKSTM